GHGDDRTLSKLLFDVLIFRFTFGNSKAPPIIMDHDLDMIRIVKGRSGSIERGIIELPLGRSELPNQLRKLLSVFFVAGATTFGGKIELIPPFELSLWRQRDLASFLVADQITAHGDHGLAALRPERCEDVGG